MVAGTSEREQAAELYAATFAGRRDVYSVWAGDHWQSIRKPLTAQTILNAFDTKVPLSAYPLTLESTAHVTCLDFDRDNGLDIGRQFMRWLASLKIPAYIEPSRRGCHVWMIIEKPLPGVLVRRALHGMIVEAQLPPCPGGRPIPHPKTGHPVCPGCMGPVPDLEHNPRHDDPKIELRPASDKLSGPDGLGHCIRMPTMPHPKTLLRYGLTSIDGEMLPGKLTEMMLEIELVKPSVFEEAAGRAPLPPLGRAPRDLRNPHGEPPSNDSASDILRELYGVLDARPGKAVHCPSHDDQVPSLSIAHDDQRAFCKAPGCLLHNDGRGRGTIELRNLAPRRAGHA